MGEIEVQIQAAREGELVGAGVAYVTFASMEDATRFISDYSVGGGYPSSKESQVPSLQAGPCLMLARALQVLQASSWDVSRAPAAEVLGLGLGLGLGMSREPLQLRCVRVRVRSS